MEWSRTADGPARVEALLLSWRKPNDFLLATHCIIARARGSTAACLCRGLDGGAPDHGRRNDCCRWPGVVPSTTHGAPGCEALVGPLSLHRGHFQGKLAHRLGPTIVLEQGCSRS